ncbi:C6 finger domain-containing protein [Ilyonectria robusta]|uniref:C6 finger domain-containing protein n=1 Tax=Ilyonectria robusta TaxID=1079257 RepID=UPI001E8D5A1B|nr:C6 finger domain-containing protein [Ilyonectria robusta]KAH8686440.1 C6 finger domain-containing protein [Ilyonectria robusta]
MDGIDHDGHEPTEPERKRPAKLFHKKSRNGCQQCRARRVKCNEAKPICGGCQRLELTCVYDRQRLGNNAATSSSARTETMGDPPESRDRRKLELQLFYHYTTETGPSLAVDKASYDLWVAPLPRLALQSDALLYSMFSLAALHSASQDEAKKDHHMSICHTYLDMTVREHAKEVSQLSKENVDALCLTSSMLRIYYFLTLQERSLQPYRPPTEWMRATGSSSAIFRQAWPMVKDNPDSIAFQMITYTPVIRDVEARTGEENRRGLLHLLRRQESHELAESWDAEVQEAYESTLSYIGGIWIAMNDHEPPAGVARRLVIFPMLVNKRFIDLVEEQRPRALAILAHYFALLAMLRCFWWVGDVGQREVHAIAEVMPVEWQGAMSWPLEILEQQIVFTGEEVTRTK